MTADRPPLIDVFRRGNVPREVRLRAARGEVTAGADEQLELLLVLTGDADPEVASVALWTLHALPRAAVESFLATAAVSPGVREFFRARWAMGESAVASSDPGVAADGSGATEPDLEEAISPPVEAPDGAMAEEGSAAAEAAREQERLVLSSLPVVERIRIATHGTREQRAQLIRDPNRLVSSAVLSSPKLSDPEVEAFARMGNVPEEVLRIIGSSRAWTRNYAVVVGLARNPKTPLAISMALAARLNPRDLKALAIDRNVPEGVRVTARKMLAAADARKG